MTTSSHEPPTAEENSSTNWDQNEWIEHLTTVLGTPSTAGNSIDVLKNGDEIFGAMLEAIGAAETSIDLVTFVYWSGDVAVRFADALAAAAKRGCSVRILLDAMGARRSDDDVVDTMRTAGCQVKWFRPLWDGWVPQLHKVNHRTHRKIMVCDGKVGFTGGVGIADEWDGDANGPDEWRDTHVRLRGPGVAGLQAGFIDNWSDAEHASFDPSAEQTVSLDPVGSSTCTVIRGSAEVGASEMWRLVMALIAGSQHHLDITSAYFNPDEPMIAALCAAAERGVEVRVLVPGEHADKRFVQMAGEAEYQRLMDAGIAVWNYDTSMMHAKIISVDGIVATVGSANFNSRSMEHDEETNLVVFDVEVVATLNSHFDEDLRSSTPLDPARWARRSAPQRALEQMTSLVGRWL